MENHSIEDYVNDITTKFPISSVDTITIRKNLSVYNPPFLSYLIKLNKCGSNVSFKVEDLYNFIPLHYPNEVDANIFSERANKIISELNNFYGNDKIIYQISDN